MSDHRKNLVVIYGSGASYDSGYEVMFADQNDPTIPPMDRNFLKDDRIKKLISQRYHALHKFQNLYYKACNSLEEMWTELDLNHKHIKLGTYLWKKETEEYLELIKDDKKNNYPEMDRGHVGAYLDSPLYNKFKFTGDCGRDLRLLIYDVYSKFELKKNHVNNYSELEKIISEQEESGKVKQLAYVTFNFGHPVFTKIIK